MVSQIGGAKEIKHGEKKQGGLWALASKGSEGRSAKYVAMSVGGGGGRGRHRGENGGIGETGRDLKGEGKRHLGQQLHFQRGKKI